MNDSLRSTTSSLLHGGGAMAKLGRDWAVSIIAATWKDTPFLCCEKKAAHCCRLHAFQSNVIGTKFKGAVDMSLRLLVKTS